MKLSNQPPPKHIYDKAKELWNIDFEKGTIFTYGDTIHSKKILPRHLLVHEKVHIEQQTTYEGGPEAWWKEYFKNNGFRLTQETEAYQKQVNWIKLNIKDKEEAFKLIREIAVFLSSEMYGNLIGFTEALRVINNLDNEN